jgi:hypothetical protein
MWDPLKPSPDQERYHLGILLSPNWTLFETLFSPYYVLNHYTFLAAKLALLENEIHTTRKPTSEAILRVPEFPNIDLVTHVISFILGDDLVVKMVSSTHWVSPEHWAQYLECLAAKRPLWVIESCLHSSVQSTWLSLALLSQIPILTLSCLD